MSEEIGSDYDTWSDFETQMGRYTEKFDLNNKQLCRQQFHDFQTEFIEYLRGEQKKLTFADQKKIEGMMRSALTDFYSLHNLRTVSHNTVAAVFSSNQGYAHTYNFISFNYTSILEECLSSIPSGIVTQRKPNGVTLQDRIGNIVHVHGTLDNAPIMGVDNKSQVSNKVIAEDDRFLRYLVKPLLNTVHRTNHDEEAKKLILNSQVICIYGMALGETDRRWWVRILNWLNGSQSRQLIIFDYDPDFNNSSQFDWVDKEDSYIDKLAGYVSDTKVDVEKLRSQIHIAVHKNIFEMNLRVQQEKRDEKEPYSSSESTKASSDVNSGLFVPVA